VSFYRRLPLVQLLKYFTGTLSAPRPCSRHLTLNPLPKSLKLISEVLGRALTFTLLLITIFSDDGNVIKQLLTRLTHHSTFPNVLVRGTSIGGSDQLQELHATKALKKIFEEAGVTVRSNGPKQL
jgi:glutaredoxin-related protein